jgi:exonuclease SbcD
MRILHTSDWHLGVKLENQSREIEHQYSLEWLSELIKAENVEALIVAGDIFDVYMPANYAQRLYYNFLKSLINSCCQHIIIVGGNHDSPNLLEASRELLELLNIHVVAQPTAEPQSQIIELREPKTQELKAVVAAVPYLSEAHLRKNQAGETAEQRREQIQNGIIAHYQIMAELVQPYAAQNVPIISTGHLYAAGGQRGGRQDLIHLGNIDLLDADTFPAIFGYIALGHLHKAHPLGQTTHIRYAGSLLPLDFNESNYKHQVNIIDFEGAEIKKIYSHANPFARKLQLIQGTFEEVKAALLALPTELPTGQLFKTWLKIELFSDSGFKATLKQDLNAFLSDKPAEILGEPVQRRSLNAQEREEFDPKELVPSLDTISVAEVFAMRLKAEKYDSEALNKRIAANFGRLRSWYEEQNRLQE